MKLALKLTNYYYTKTYKVSMATSDEVEHFFCISSLHICYIEIQKEKYSSF